MISPLFGLAAPRAPAVLGAAMVGAAFVVPAAGPPSARSRRSRSEERRVGKECGSRRGRWVSAGGPGVFSAVGEAPPAARLQRAGDVLAIAGARLSLGDDLSPFWARSAPSARRVGGRDGRRRVCGPGRRPAQRKIEAQ